MKADILAWFDADMPAPDLAASLAEARSALHEARMQAIADTSRVEMVCEDLAKARAEVERLTSVFDAACAHGKHYSDRVAALTAANEAMRTALEDIGVYGCGMLNQPAAMNAPEEVWLSKRIRHMEEVARAALAQSSGPEVG
jgi:hypothetical protein